MRRSRWIASSALSRTRAASVLTSRPTISITAKVTRYCVSATANVRCGGTKKKSKTATLAIAAKTEGPRP